MAAKSNGTQKTISQNLLIKILWYLAESNSTSTVNQNLSSVYFSQVSACELQHFSCHDLANDITHKLPKLCSATLTPLIDTPGVRRCRLDHLHVNTCKFGQLWRTTALNQLMTNSNNRQPANCWSTVDCRQSSYCCSNSASYLLPPDSFWNVHFLMTLI